MILFVFSVHLIE